MLFVRIYITFYQIVFRIEPRKFGVPFVFPINETSTYIAVGACSSLWELRDSNPRPSACKADALNQLS